MDFGALSHSIVTVLFTITWQAAVLVGLILITQKLLGRFLPARWRFALWSLLLARLLLPWTPGTVFSIYNLAGAPRVAASQAIPDATEPQSQPSSSSGNEQALQLVPSVVEAVSAEHSSFWIVLCGGWIAGILLVGTHTIVMNARLVSRIKQGRQVINIQVLKLLEACKAETGVTIPIWVVETAEVQTPALMGFFRPRLLLPQNFSQTFTAEELRYVFLHELAHLARGDTGIDLLMAGLQMVHWFNPAVWFAFARMRADRELACDAYVLQVTGEVAKRRYGQALVNLVERLSAPVPTVAMIGILEDGRTIKDRVLAITRFTSSHSRAWKFGTAALCLLGLLALTDRIGPQNSAPKRPNFAAEESEPRVAPLAVHAEVQQRTDAAELTAAKARISQLEQALERTQAENRSAAQQASRELDDLRKRVRELAEIEARKESVEARRQNVGAGNGDGDDRRRGIPFEPHNDRRRPEDTPAGRGPEQQKPPPNKAQVAPPKDNPVAGGNARVPAPLPVAPPVPPVAPAVPPGFLGPAGPVVPAALPPAVPGGTQDAQENVPRGFVAAAWRTDGTAPTEDDEIVRGTLSVVEKSSGLKMTLAVNDPTVPRSLQVSRGSVYNLKVPALLARDMAMLARLQAKVQVRGVYEDNEFVVHAVREVRERDSAQPMLNLDR